MAQIRTRETAAQVGDAGTVINNEGPLSNSQIDQNFINLNNDIATRLPLSGGTLTGQLTVPANFTVQAQGAEGGEIVLKKGSAQTSLAGDVILDTLGDTFRVFENGGNFRQIFFNLTNGNITGAGGISINIDGNAATVTNGVYTTGNQTISGTKTFTGTTILGGGSSFIENPTAQNSWFSTAAYGTSQGDNRTHFGYHTTTPGVYYNYIRGAKTFVAADLEVGGTLTNAGNQILHAGNYSTYTINNAGRIKTYYIDSLNAVLTQAKRYEIARIGIDFNDWNATGSFEVELLENYFRSGLKKRYSVNYGYGSVNSLTLVEMSGVGDNNFRVITGTPVQVSGDHYYLPVYVDVANYSGCSVIIRTNRLITTATNTAIGYAYINTNPTGSDISNFVADSVVNMSNSASDWQVGGNTVLHVNNYSTYLNGQYLRAITTLPPYQSWNVTGNQTNVINQINQENFNVGTTGNSDFPASATYKYGLLLNLTASSSQAQIYVSHNGNDLIFRGGWGGTSWQAWNKVLTDQNYSSYALPLTGGTVTGATTLNNATVVGSLRGSLTGATNSTIWAVSGDYTNWGIFYKEGTPDFIEFRTGGTTTAKIGLDDGQAHFGEVTLNGINTWFAAANTHLRSNNEFLFLTNGGGAQKARFHGIQVGGSYGGTIPDQGILFSGDTTLTRTATNTLTASGNFIVTGDLIVNGTTTTVNSTTVTIDDPIFTLGGDTAPTTDDSKDRGVEFRWHNGSAAKVGFFGFDDSTGKFTFIPDATNTSEVFSGTKGTIDAYLDWSNITNNGETLATVTGRGATTSTNVSLLGTGNHYSGHFYLDSYDAAGNHYPHFNDGPNGTGSIVNWRLFTGSTNTTTHVWTNEYTQFNNSLRAPNGIISGGNASSAYDATLLVTATNNNDWAIIVDKNNASATEYGIDIRVGSAANYAFRVVGNGVEGVRINGTGTVFAKSFVDIENNSYFLDLDGDHSLKVYGEISNSNYAAGNMQPGALNIGRTDINYSYTGTTWASDIKAGILANCNETWEFVVHDSGDSVNSAFYFDGGARFMLGRDIGWGTPYIEAPGSFRSTAFYASDNTSFWWRPAADGVTHRFYTTYGSISIGPQNTSHCHITTDLPNIWFNKDLQVDGSYRIYGDTSNRFSQGALVLRGTGPTVYLRDTDHMSAQLHVNADTFYLLRGGVDSEGWTQLNSAWPLEINLGTNNALFGGTVRTYSDFRANIYYDINDTNYYVDPAGYSKLNILTTNTYYQASDITIGYLDTNASAAITAGGSNVLGDGVKQDMLAFNPPTTAETWNGSAWSSVSVPTALFAGKIAQAWGNFNLPAGTTKARFTWNSFGYRYWHSLNASHTTQGNSIRFILETSTDGITWVSKGTSGWTSSWPGYSTWTITGNSYDSIGWMRITIERDSVNTNTVNIGSLSLMGSYGGFSRLFDWDYQRNVTFYNTVQAVDFNSTSDVTKKKDIKTIEGALELIMKLRGVTFNWISTDKPSMGLIAQEVESVLPQVVHTGEDGTKTISYGNLVGLLVECVKAQEDRLTRLENLVLHKA